jgi:hypothetical protein
MITSADLEANRATKPNISFCIHYNKKGHIEPKY